MSITSTTQHRQGEPAGSADRSRAARRAWTFRTRALLVAAGCTLALVACDDARRSDAERLPEPWLAGAKLPAYLDCAREHSATLLQAHRAGLRAGRAENSLAAITSSLADGAVFLELDVAKTADGVLVLMHDDTVDRTTVGQGRVAAMTYAELSSLELVDGDGQPTGERVPSFAEALAALEGRGFAQVDLKGEVTVDDVAVALEAADAVEQALIITYSLADAVAAHERLPGAMLSVGIGGVTELSELIETGIPLDRVSAWIGIGRGNPELDAALAAYGLETSYGDFAAERQGSIDYAAMAAAGAEVLSVDNVEDAARALDAAAAARDLLAVCPQAFDAASDAP